MTIFNDDADFNNSGKPINLSAPINSGDAARKSYVDSLSPLSIVGNGFVVKTSLNTLVKKSLTANSNRISITHGDGDAGNPVFDVIEANLNIANMTGILPLTRGGSGQTTANASLNAFLPSQTSNSGKILKTDGSNASWSSLQTTGISLRNGVMSGKVDANGIPSYLGVGSGLTPQFLGSSTNALINYANGFTAQGETGSLKTISTDSSFPTLPANQLCYLFDDYTDGLNYSLTPEQSGGKFDIAHNALLHFEGTNGSTTFTDEFGNTWSAVGNAQISTAQAAFGSSSLLLDGTGDGIDCNGLTNILGNINNRWSIEMIGRWGTLPTTGTRQTLIHFSQAASDYGIEVDILNTTGTYTLRTYLSSDGTTHNIASDGASSSITVATGNWYHVAIDYDGATYRLYFNGVQVYSVASALRIASISNKRVGLTRSGTQGINGWIDELRFTNNACRYPAGTTFTPATSAFSPDAHWFDTNAMVMKYGSPSSWELKQRVFLGKALTGASSVASVTSNPLLRISQNSEVYVMGGNGHGSTNNKIRRFTIQNKSIGNAITYADDAANGSSFTINENGIYGISYTDGIAAGTAANLGVSINSGQLTTSIELIDNTSRLGLMVSLAATNLALITRLNAGDIIRPHTAGTQSRTDNFTNFRIIKIGV